MTVELSVRSDAIEPSRQDQRSPGCNHSKSGGIDHFAVPDDDVQAT